jgi:hypothetical protein
VWALVQVMPLAVVLVQLRAQLMGGLEQARVVLVLLALAAAGSQPKTFQSTR